MTSRRISIKHTSAPHVEKYPHLPDWPGRDSFNGKILHAAALGDIRPYARRDILVIGAGNSGTDVLNHLSRIATGKVWVSLRHGSTIMPTRLFGYTLSASFKFR